MKDDAVIIMPFMLPWDWSADYQRQTCIESAKHHKVIVYLQKDAIFILKGLFDRYRFGRSGQLNIIFYRPLYILPFRRFEVLEQVNTQVSFILFQLLYLRTRSGVLWIFDPAFYPLVKTFRGITIYDCVDYAWSRELKARHAIQSMEKKLIRAVTYFFVNSYILKSIHNSVRKPDALVPQGFRYTEFKRSGRRGPMFPKDKPIIGYVGAINHRIDFTLLERIIRHNSHINFVLWGRVQETEKTDEQEVIVHMARLSQYQNVITGWSADRSQIRQIIAQFSIGIIPYNTKLDSVKYCHPMKLFEYFYVGIPAISTPIEEVQRYSSFVKIGKNSPEWEKHITFLLSRSWPEKQKVRQRDLAKANSWEKKISYILSFIK